MWTHLFSSRTQKLSISAATIAGLAPVKIARCQVIWLIIWWVFFLLISKASKAVQSLYDSDDSFSLLQFYRKSNCGIQIGGECLYNTVVSPDKTRVECSTAVLSLTWFYVQESSEPHCMSFKSYEPAIRDITEIDERSWGVSLPAAGSYSAILYKLQK